MQVIHTAGVPPSSGRTSLPNIGWMENSRHALSTTVAWCKRRTSTRESAVGPIRRSGPDYLAYAIIDAVIDGYYPLLESFGGRLEALENQIVEAASPSLLQEIHGVKRELLAMRRAVWPQREAVGGLTREESEFVTDNVRTYLRDVYDHCVQIIDVVETYRELAGGLMDVYLSSIGNRQNEVMKVLTIMASIFIPLTFLAGIYGMNFDHMPELHARWAYPILLGVMAVLAVGKGDPKAGDRSPLLGILSDSLSHFKC